MADGDRRPLIDALGIAFLVRHRYAAILRSAAPYDPRPLSGEIIIVGALVLVEVTAGITEASMTLSPSSPCSSAGRSRRKSLFGPSGWNCSSNSGSALPPVGSTNGTAYSRY